MASLEGKSPAKPRRLPAQVALAYEWRRLFLFLALVSAALYGTWRLASRPRADYIMVIDAGSSGTRLYAYTWLPGAAQGDPPRVEAIPPSAAAHKVPRRAMPAKRAYQRVETEPGLDKFAVDGAGLRSKSLGPLLEWAQAAVPRRRWGRTPVFLCATAGLRKLPNEQQEQLMSSVRSILKKSPFRFEERWARIISGEDEGVYGWIALNYLSGAFASSSTAPPAAAGAAEGGEEVQADGAPGGSSAGGGGGKRLRRYAPRSTLGVLDLGGSSLEVAFELDRSASAALGPELRKDTVNVTLFGHTHSLYVHVHHHYGLNDAFDRSVSLLLSLAAGPSHEGRAGAGAAEGAGKAAATAEPGGSVGGEARGQAAAGVDAAAGDAKEAAMGGDGGKELPTEPPPESPPDAPPVAVGGGSSGGSSQGGHAAPSKDAAAGGSETGASALPDDVAADLAVHEAQLGQHAQQLQLLERPEGAGAGRTTSSGAQQQQQGAGGGDRPGLDDEVAAHMATDLAAHEAQHGEHAQQGLGGPSGRPADGGDGGTGGEAGRPAVRRLQGALLWLLDSTREQVLAAAQAQWSWGSGGDSATGSSSSSSRSSSGNSGRSGWAVMQRSAEQHGAAAAYEAIVARLAAEEASSQPHRHGLGEALGPQEQQQQQQQQGRQLLELEKGGGRELSAAPGAGQEAAGSGQPAGDGSGASGSAAGHLLEVPHPCLHTGYAQTYTRLAMEGAATPDPAEVLLVGRPDREGCARLAEAVVNASAPCGASACALGAPAPPVTGTFSALTGFYVVYHFFGLHTPEEMQRLDQVVEEFCSKPWGQAERERANEIHVDRYCFRAPFITTLLGKGLELGLEGRRVQIGSPNVGWTLGAALAEGSRLGIQGAKTPALSFVHQAALLHLPSLGRRGLGLVVAATGVALLAVAAVLRRRRRQGGGGPGDGGGGAGPLVSWRGELRPSPSDDLLAAERGGLGGVDLPPGLEPAAVGSGGLVGGLSLGGGGGSGGLPSPPTPTTPIFARLFGTPRKKRVEPPAPNLALGGAGGGVGGAGGSSWQQGPRDMRKDLSMASLARISRSQAVSRRGISISSAEEVLGNL